MNGGLRDVMNRSSTHGRPCKRHESCPVNDIRAREVPPQPPAGTKRPTEARFYDPAQQPRDPPPKEDTLRTTDPRALALGIAVLVSGVAEAADPSGKWRTERGEATIRIHRCGGALCGRIIALREPNDPITGRPKTDKNNRDARLRRRPLIGVQIAVRMKAARGPGRWTGHIYNPEDGGLYPATLTLLGPRTLRVEGCIVKDVLCQSQTWTRTR